ncbi:MAG: hypothetical protein ACM3TR_10845 [Caulobacteraceae bacterium]
MDAGPGSNSTRKVNKTILYGRVGVSINSSHYITEFDKFAEITNNM